MLRRPTQHVLGSVVACQRARRRLASKTDDEETNLYGGVDSSFCPIAQVHSLSSEGEALVNRQNIKDWINCPLTHQ